jgi:hypothetical protein
MLITGFALPYFKSDSRIFWIGVLPIERLSGRPLSIKAYFFVVSVCDVIFRLKSVWLNISQIIEFQNGDIKMHTYSHYNALKHDS